MGVPPHSTPRWAHELTALLARLRTEGGESVRADLWRVLHAGLYAALRAQAGAIVSLSVEDLEDLTSGKALELLRQAEGSQWGEGSRSANDHAGYLWRVARNALVDLARQRGREAPPPENEAAWDRAFADRIQQEAGPVDWTAAHEFADALAGCVGKLAPRARSAWWLRAGLERPSREIGTRLGVASAHVDVIVQRARAELTHCMSSQGHVHMEIHPQAFVVLWSRLAPVIGEHGVDR